ncbi:type B 50S ribosomal protein L31 [Candidatus Saccharibacteria bacterium]|nr:type B 50S ribosomal protein L31 [Candidatus Saccharibacteria bacterium]
MKADIHPSSYRPVVFQDINNGQNFLVKSTAQTKETIKYEDGQTYPLVKLHITSASHPFYTGQEKVIDVEGRIDKFENRRKAALAAREKLRAKTAKAGRKSAKSQPKAEKNADEPAGVEQPPGDET